MKFKEFGGNIKYWAPVTTKEISRYIYREKPGKFILRQYGTFNICDQHFKTLKAAKAVCVILCSLEKE